MSDYLKEGFIDEVKGALKGEGGSGQDNVIEKIKVNGVEQAVDPNKAVDIPVPTKTSELENDEGFLTEHQDLSDYAKKADVPTVPTNVSEFTNDSDYQTADDVSKTVTDEVAKIVNNAPEDFDTLKEMSDWIAGHENDASAMNSAIQDNKNGISELNTNMAAHTGDKNNPHGVTKSDVGLGNVDNTSDLDKPVSKAQATAIADAKKAGTDAQNNLTSHIGNTNNPHSVTKSQVGLGNVGNFKAVSTVASQELSDTEKSNARTNIGAGTSSLTLGETSSTAYRGDKGKTAYEHSQKTSGNPHGVTKSDVGLGNVDNTADLDKPISTATQTALDEINSNLDYNASRNMFDGKFEQGNGNSNITTRVRSSRWIKVQKDKQYTMSVKNIGSFRYYIVVTSVSKYPSSPSLEVYDSGWKTGNHTFTSPIDGYVFIGVAHLNDTALTPSDISELKFQLERGSVATEYEEYRGDSNAFLTEEVNAQNESLDTLEFGEVAGGKNILDYTSIGENFSNNTTGTSFSFSNGEYVITRVNNFNSGIYTYSSLLNVLDGKKIRLSFDAKTDTSGMSIRFCLGNGNGYVTKELTEEYKRYASDFNITTSAPLIFYGNALAGNMYIKNIMFEDITNSESIDSTYKPYIPSVKMLAEEIDKQNASLYSLSNGTLTNITNGYYYNNGVVSSDSDSSYGIINNLQSGNELCWENANTLISQNPMLIDFFNGDTYVSQSSVTSSSGSITIPSNVTRAILSMPTTSMTTIKVTSGVVAALKKDLGNYAPKSNPTCTGSFSLNRKSGTTVGDYSTTEGKDCTASGAYSHAEGGNSIASYSFAHAEGNETTSTGQASHAEGIGTIALDNQHAQGHYNSAGEPNSITGTSTGTAFVIGNGTSGSKSNAFRVTGEGVIYSTNATVQAGADYAEYFEWSDENKNKEDRVGLFVTFDENAPEKIRIANSGDYILGIVSGMPSVIGNGDEDWKKRFILDEFGRYIVEEFEYEEKIIDEETGEETTVTKIGTKWKENPDYDESKPYVSRKERPEWSAIGMLGVLSVYDDGTCQVNGYCKVSDGGIATKAENKSDGYRVIARVTDNIIKIVFR